MTDGLNFTTGSDGRSTLVVTGDVPAFLQQAYMAAAAGRREQARDLLTVERLAGLDMVDTQTAFLLAETYYYLKDWSAAETCYERTTETEPHAMAYYRLGRICTMTGRWSKAVEYDRMAYQADPENAFICCEYATDQMRAGRTEEGMDLLRQAVELAPDNSQFNSYYLFSLSYQQDLDPHAILGEHRRWAALHAPASLARRSHANIPDPGRRLRIGYLSTEFRRHSTLYNFEPFLEGRDLDRFEVFGYGDVAMADEVTDRLRSRFDQYRDIHGLDDASAASRIEQDQIDILVVIGGHVPDNRLRVLAYKPAPIQIDYGAVSTTGMAQIDYRFTDRLRDGPESEDLYVEQPVYLSGFDCYRPPDFAPPVGPLPALQKGCVTFACFNNRLKITPHVLSLWARVLSAGKTSRLLLKFKAGEVGSVRALVLERLRRAGVDPGRIEIHGWKSGPDHLALYNQADIALDTFPFSGCITTLESLWMGLPVISRIARQPVYWVSRMGLSHLTRVGLEYFACETDDEYVAKACALARNVQALTKIRASMRRRMTAPGGLCDAKAYMQGVEQAYHWMWQHWCDKQIQNPKS